MSSLSALALLQSVAKVEMVLGTYKCFAKRDVKKAVLACKAQAIVGSLSRRQFTELVSESFTALKTISVTCSNLTNPQTVCGPKLSGVCGKTRREKPARLETEEIYIPRYFYGSHKFVTLTADVMFVNSVPFLVTMSRKIRQFTVKSLFSRPAAQLTHYLVKVTKLYARGRFTVRTILMDQEFDKVMENMPAPLRLTPLQPENTWSKLRGVLDWSRSDAEGPFVIHLVYFCVMWLNSFPV